MGHQSGAAVLEVAGVGHEYDSGTPWAKTALRESASSSTRATAC